MKLLQRNPRLILICLLWAWCMTMESLRWRYTIDPPSANLKWNLFLATVPVLCAMAMQRLQPRPLLTTLLGLMWLVFLPNAPYLLTDLFHLRSRPSLPLWIDLAVLLAHAGAGITFCYLSLYDVQVLVQKQCGASAGWLVAGGSLLLSGFGIYLGRYLRLNSWYLVTHPAHVFHKSLNLIGIDQTLPNVWAVTLVYGIGLILGYLVLRLLIAAVRQTG